MGREVPRFVRIAAAALFAFIAIDQALIFLYLLLPDSVPEVPILRFHSVPNWNLRMDLLSYAIGTIACVIVAWRLLARRRQPAQSSEPSKSSVSTDPTPMRGP